MPSWIKKLLTITISLTIVGVPVYVFFLPKIHLELATLSMQQSIKRIQTLAVQEKHNNSCSAAAGVNSDNSAVSAYQIRFTNTSEYVLEAVCDRIGNPTVEVGKRALPGSVKKTAGSGLTWPVLKEGEAKKPHASAITLESANTSRTFNLEDTLEIVSGKQTTDKVPGADAPKTTCEGWGLICCPNAGFVGVGPQQSKVADCSERCYEVCEGSPTVLFFNTSPLLDANRNTTLLAPPYTLEVGYQLTNVKPDTKVSIDFGDGTNVQGNIQDTVSHTYQCTQATCSYEVLLSTNSNVQPLGPTSFSVTVRSK